MKTLTIILFTSIFSSAGTFVYTTKFMSPQLYGQIVDTASGYLDKIKAPQSHFPQLAQAECPDGPGRDTASPKKGIFKLLKEAQKANADRNQQLEELKNAL